MDEVGVTFSLDQLWLLNHVVRHESDQSRTWKFPPTSLELNDKIAEALLVCEESGRDQTEKLTITEYTLMLSRGDCLVIDYLVRRGMKNEMGVELGKGILLLTFKARRTLAEGWQDTAQEPLRDPEEIAAKMQEWKDSTERKRNARRKPGNDPDNQPND